MAMDASKFDAIKNKARKMIHEDAKQDSAIIKERQQDRERTYRSLKGSGVAAVTGFENIAPSYGSNGTSIGRINETYDDDNNDALYSAMDNRMNQFMEGRQTQPQTPIQQSPTQINKGLPKEILESFSNNYIDQSVFDPNRSVLDRIGVSNGQQQITEQVNQTQQVSGGKVDYELIKNIVESTVKKYINALGKKVLNENNDLAMIQIGEKKINLVTKDGNLFTADLRFQKNIKSK